MESMYGSLIFRKGVFEKFLMAKFKKGLEAITKEDLLALTAKHFSKTKIDGKGSPSSLYYWHRGNKPEGTKKNTLFFILEDLGYAEKFGITQKEVVDAGRKKIADANTIFNYKEIRKAVFEAMLKKIYGEKEITKEDLLALSEKHFHNTKIDRKGSPSVLYKWYANNEPEGMKKNTLFFILEDLSYAEKFGISEQDCKTALFKRRSETRRKRIVIIDQKEIGGPSASSCSCRESYIQFQ